MNLQHAINKASFGDGGVIHIPKGVHKQEQDAYCFYHPTLNPDYNKNPESWSRIHLRGVVSGGTTRNVSGGSIESNTHASHIAFAKDKRLIVADSVLMGESSGHTHTVSGGFVSSDIAISGDTKNPLVTIDGCPRTDVSRWNLYNKGGAAMFLHGVWESDFRQIYAKTELSWATIEVSTYRYAGGLLNLDNVTCEGGHHGLTIQGRDRRIGTMALNNFQARKCSVGIGTYGGVRNLDLINPWFEHIEKDCVYGGRESFKDGRLYVRGGSWWMAKSEADCQAYIRMNRASGDLITDAWYPLQRDYIEDVVMENCEGQWFKGQQSGDQGQ